MRYVIVVISFILYAALALIHKNREDFPFYFLILSALFAIYFYSLRSAKLGPNETLTFAIIYRLVFIGFVPVLSDDVYRFIWDGVLGLGGHNPYLFLPSAFEFSTPEGLFEKLNSPNYFSLYPPLKQYFFQIGALMGGGNVKGTIIAFRVILIGAFLINFFLIRAICNQLKYQSNKTAKVLAIYALNPFLILETAGSLHFEGLMLMFLFASFYSFLRYKSLALPAILFAFSVSIKLLPLIFLPLVWKKLGLKKGFGFVGVVLIVNLILFIPFFQLDLLSNILNSLDLYFHNFEFNASLYYLARAMGIWLTGYNLIYYLGPLLALLSLFLILKLSFSGVEFIKASLFILLIYVSCTTTVHPWYIITLLGLSLFTDFRSPVLWTYTICLSYFAYSNIPVVENQWLILLEYGLVFFAFYWEFKMKKPLF